MKEKFWHRSSNRSAEGSYSAWHGDTETGEYKTPSVAEMYSSESYLITDGSLYELNFKFWVESSAAHTRFYAFLLDESDERHIIFEDTGEINEWMDVTIDLSEFRDMEAHIGFGFESTALQFVLEGAYVDDISFHGGNPLC